MPSQTIADLLKKSRREKKLSVKEVIDALSRVNIKVAEKTLYGWEAGRSQPDIDTFLALCKIYNISNQILQEIEDHIKYEPASSPFFSDEVLEIAEAYAAASIRDRNVIRQVLGLALIKSD